MKGLISQAVSCLFWLDFLGFSICYRDEQKANQKKLESESLCSYYIFDGLNN